MTEGEFDIKEEEPWYDHQDLEHDLHLAAELGKNLLERNQDLEQRLQQVCGTSQEQLQEIEYLCKQVDLLRSVNDQHAKVYEQLDLTARDLEQKNERLVLENRAAQIKIESLTETVEGLQTQVDELQRDIKKLVSSEQNQPSSRSETTQPVDRVQGFTCKKCLLRKYSDGSYPASRTALKQEENEVEHMDLLGSVHSLQTQLNTERSLRKAAEQEADALVRNLGELEPKLALLGDYRDRLAEMEAEVEELRLILRSKCSSQSQPSDAVFLATSEEGGVVDQRGRGLMHCSSDQRFHGSGCEEGGALDSESGRGCCKQAEDVKHCGMSLLNEVDAEYVALQEKYDTLLRRCESRTLQQNHRAVQTLVSGSVQTHAPLQSVNTHDQTQPPAYKTLFHEIFTFIQKSKEDLKENRIQLNHAD